jgi:hypothetical protein
MCGIIQRTLKNKTRKDTQIKFYKVITGPMFVYGSVNWALNRSEGRKTETAKICFLRRVSEYALTDHVYTTTIRNALRKYASKEIIQVA